ncbi:MAG: polysaccharide pyruvyl transferase family protein, partial [Verrucomicrobia bacterium]|nr:polysaccharide pyruvyl transferase family protein [Verrucomicrobiota bacterium]
MTTRRQFITAAAAGLGASAFAALAKPKTILLKSAWDTVNIGDIGHTPGTLRIIEKHLPDVHVIVWAMALNGAVEIMLRRRFPKAEIVQGKLGSVALDAAFARADLIMHNSSMGTDTSLLAWCRKLGKPCGMYGQSYFPAFVESERGEEGRLGGA